MRRGSPRPAVCWTCCRRRSPWRKRRSRVRVAPRSRGTGRWRRSSGTVAGCRYTRRGTRRARARRVSDWPAIAEAWQTGVLSGAQVDVVVGLVPDRHVARFGEVAGATAAILAPLGLHNPRRAASLGRARRRAGRARRRGDRRGARAVRAGPRAVPVTHPRRRRLVTQRHLRRRRRGVCGGGVGRGGASRRQRGSVAARQRRRADAPGGGLPVLPRSRRLRAGPPQRTPDRGRGADRVVPRRCCTARGRHRSPARRVPRRASPAGCPRRGVFLDAFDGDHATARPWPATRQPPAGRRDLLDWHPRTAPHDRRTRPGPGPRQSAPSAPFNAAPCWPTTAAVARRAATPAPNAATSTTSTPGRTAAPPT